MPTIPARFNGLDHVVFRVTDIQKTVAFYKDVLGLVVERIYDKLGLYQVRCGANLIDLVSVPEGAKLAAPQDRGIEHLCLSVDADLDELIAYFAAKGIKVIRGPMEVYGARGFGTAIYILDPDGYELELKVGYTRTPVRFPPAQS
jgi:glyoxylase I family protein